MSGNVSSNTTNLVRQQVYSDMVLLPILDKLLGEGIVTDLSEFGDGDTINVPVIGECEVHDYAENQDAQYDPISTGRFTMTITEYKESGHYMTDKLKMDGRQANLLFAQMAEKERRAILEAYETSILSIQSAQTASDPNNINGVPHRFVASGTNDEIVLEDFANVAYAMTKANIPAEGRIAIVDPFVATSLDKTTNIVNVSNNPQFTGLLEKGMLTPGMEFARELYGIKVVVSNRLATVASETVSGNAVSNAKAALFMSIASDQTRPIARAWRLMPTVEATRNASKGRDEMHTRARWGRGLLRPDGLVVCLGAVPSSGFGF